MKSGNLTAVIAGCVGLGLFGEAMATTAEAQPFDPALANVEELKRIYLECDRAATAAHLNAGDAMRCSVVYEELKRRVFDGDFKRLKAWSDAQKRRYDVAG